MNIFCLYCNLCTKIFVVVDCIYILLIMAIIFLYISNHVNNDLTMCVAILKIC